MKPHINTKTEAPYPGPRNLDRRFILITKLFCYKYFYQAERGVAAKMAWPEVASAEAWSHKPEDGERLVLHLKIPSQGSGLSQQVLTSSSEASSESTKHLFLKSGELLKLIGKAVWLIEKLCFV